MTEKRPKISDLAGYKRYYCIKQTNTVSYYIAKNRDAKVAEKQGGNVLMTVLSVSASKNKELVERFHQETRFLRSQTYTSFPKPLGIFYVDGIYYRISTWFYKGTSVRRLLENATGPLSWKKGRRLLHNVTEIVAHFHSQNLPLGELSGDLIWLDGKGKLFFIKTLISEHEDLDLYSTAPELKSSSQLVSMESDIYSLGLFFYLVLAGRLPWEEGESPYSIQKRKMHNDISSPTAHYPHIPQNVVGFIRRMMTPEPYKRPKIWEISDSLFPREQKKEAIPVSKNQSPVPPKDPKQLSKIESALSNATQYWYLGLLVLVPILYTLLSAQDSPIELLPKNTYETMTITKGDFDMGCTKAGTKRCFSDEGPARKETVGYDLEVMKTEVTQGVYAHYMKQNPSFFTSCGSNCPVEQVSWYDAIAFANRLSKQENLNECYEETDGVVAYTSESCTGWRLPTEKEWEYIAHKISAENLGDAELSNVKQTHPKCSFHKKETGICDIFGNVWEWTWSTEVQGIKIKEDSQSIRVDVQVRKGGAWSSRLDHKRKGFRSHVHPISKDNHTGFRLVRTIQ